MKNNNSENNLTDTDCTLIDEERRNNIGYLAQHRLFDQIPVLLKDISTPDYCALLTPDDEDDNENHCANHNKNHNDNDNLNHNENDNENKKESDIDVRELGQRNEIDKNKGKIKIRIMQIHPLLYFFHLYLPLHLAIHLLHQTILILQSVFILQKNGQNPRKQFLTHQQRVLT